VNRSSALPEVIGLSAGRALDLQAGAWAGAIDYLMSEHDDFRKAARVRAEKFTWQRTARRMLRLHGLLGQDSAVSAA
jgi:hypothetical protein